MGGLGQDLIVHLKLKGTCQTPFGLHVVLIKLTLPFMTSRIGLTLYGGRNGQVNDQMHDKIIKGLVQYDYSQKT